MKHESKIIRIILVASVLIFFAFGLFHLAKFETVDEHFWKYTRINRYWQAISNGDWEKTYINDKPGVTVALVSGVGLLFEPNPERHIISDPDLTKNGLFFLFNTDRTELINYTFRLPILVFSTLSFFLFFWFIKRAFGSPRLAILSVVFLCTNPILVGISQIVNPDSLLWIFSGLAYFAFWALIRTKEKKFIFLAGIFSGFALLSKYTSIAMFILYFLTLFSESIFVPFQDEKKESRANFLFYGILKILAILIIAICVFSIFIPAIFLDPKAIFGSFIQFFDGKKVALLFLSVILFSGILFFKKNWLEKSLEFLFRYRKILLSLVSCIFLAIAAFNLINVWSGEKIVPFDLLREEAYANEPKKFNFGDMFKKNDPAILKASELLLMEPYPFIFSLTLISFVVIILFSIKLLRKNTEEKSASVFFSLIVFFLLYFIGAYSAKVVTNVRYCIILYPLFSFLSAVSVVELLKSIKLDTRKNIFILSLAILMFGAFSLLAIRPFYFSYANSLLPEKFTIHDSWGYGSYEAAQYLNSLPDPEDQIIWSNSVTICPFLRGKCLTNKKIDLNIVTPDYFVISKRDALKIKRRFVLLNSNSEKNTDYYYDKLENGYEWQLLIDDRPENYIKIIKFEK